MIGNHMNMNEVFFIKLSLKDAKIDHCNIKTEKKKFTEGLIFTFLQIQGM